LRYTWALAMALADIVALSLSRDASYSADRQTLLNWVAEARRGTILQGDAALLSDLEDKHMFTGEQSKALALDVGFATAEALNSIDGNGPDIVGGLLARIGVGEPIAGQVIRLWPSYAQRYLALLHSKDQPSGYMFWLTKPTLPVAERSFAVAPTRQPQRSSEAAVTGGGMPLRWALSASAMPAPDGLRLNLRGWCLANADIKAVRLTVDGVSHATPVWFPRPGVHLAINPRGQYGAWNSLCCGVEAEWCLDMGHFRSRAQTSLGFDLVFCDYRYVPIVAAATLAIGLLNSALTWRGWPPHAAADTRGRDGFRRIQS